jgi:hypothetical protein
MTWLAGAGVFVAFLLFLFLGVAVRDLARTVRSLD